MSQHALLLNWKMSLSPYFMTFWGIRSEFFYGLGQRGIGTARAGSHSATTGDTVRCKKLTFLLTVLSGKQFPNNIRRYMDSLTYFFVETHCS